MYVGFFSSESKPSQAKPALSTLFGYSYYHFPELMDKTQRLVDDFDIVNSIDRISKLPTELLCHILTYLPAKDAVATSILSKRWEYLWTSTSNLDFTDQFRLSGENDYLNKFSIFKDYVDRVLFHHGGSTIQKCSLSCYTYYASPYIYAWVCAIVCCNVREFTLQSTSLRFQDLPWSLFTCKTLVVLKINGGFVVNLPIYFCFPNLKTLHLRSIVYVDDASIQRLFSSCPVLEDLDISRRDWDGVQILSISVPSLKRLSIFSNMTNIVGHEYKTEINAPYLEYLKLGDRTWKNCSMNVSSSLVEAHVVGKCVYGLLKGISHVKLLDLSGDAIQSLHIVLRDHDLPTLHYLTRLELCVASFIDWKLLPNLLISSPKLEVLVFPMGIVVPKDDGIGFRGFYWVSPECEPECLLLHLKTIEVQNFVGMPGEVRLVKYLLESAKVLDRMIVHCYDFGVRSRMRKQFEWVQDEILNAPRRSIACQLEFIN